MEQLSSGVLGLVVGAFLGLALSVLFEDALKRSIGRRSRSSRSRAGGKAGTHIGTVRHTRLPA